MNAATGIGLTVALLAVQTVQADEAVAISEAKKDDNGFLVHEVRSPFQANTTKIRVLRPDREEEKRKKYPVVYVLPVEAGTEGQYGDGLKEVKKLDLHNTLGAVFVAPTFSHLPLGGDLAPAPGARSRCDRHAWPPVS